MLASIYLLPFTLLFGIGCCVEVYEIPTKMNYSAIPMPCPLITSEMIKQHATPIYTHELFSENNWDCTEMSNHNSSVFIGPTADCKQIPQMGGGLTVNKDGVVDKLGEISATYLWIGTHFYWPAIFTINGIQYNISICGDFMNPKYKTKEEAAKFKDGIKTFVYAIALQKENNTEAITMINALGKLKKHGSSIRMESKSAVGWWTNNMSNENMIIFYGTSVTPPYNIDRTYLVSPVPSAHISPEQLKAFKELKTESGETVERNIRELQEPPPPGNVVHVVSSPPNSGKGLVPWDWKKVPDLPTDPTLSTVSNVPAPPKLPDVPKIV